MRRQESVLFCFVFYEESTRRKTMLWYDSWLPEDSVCTVCMYVISTYDIVSVCWIVFLSCYYLFGLVFFYSACFIRSLTRIRHCQLLACAFLFWLFLFSLFLARFRWPVRDGWADAVPTFRFVAHLKMKRRKKVFSTITIGATSFKSRDVHSASNVWRRRLMDRISQHDGQPSLFTTR